MYPILQIEKLFKSRISFILPLKENYLRLPKAF